MNKAEIRKDMQAFADDDANIVFDSYGNVMFTRNGNDVSFKVHSDNGSGKVLIEYQERTMTYRDFISKELAKLELFAARIVEKRKRNEIYINGPAHLKMAFGDRADKCLNLLQDECNTFYEFATKITFITADAGHGKTALLKEFQFEQAKRYLDHSSNFLFWHVDLQGRDLVRLPEAIMYDLAELRISGLFYSSILYLIRNKFIILAIDGFDELAAEIGGISALGALTSLVSEMDGQGTLIAASRRTFFDTNDYLKRTSMLKGKISPDCEFNELKLKNWTSEEVIEFASSHFLDPEKLYEDLLDELHEADHPILTRPFLLTKTIQALIESKISPSEFFGSVNNSDEGIILVVEAFTKREVNKWKEWDQETGKPYLSFDQHMDLLSLIAREMWENQKDSITLEEVQFLTTFLLDEWNVEESVKPKIIRLVESHAFLIPSLDTRNDIRKFEHVEFKNYFLSRALAKILSRTSEGANVNELRKFLYLDQLPDSVGRYCMNYIKDLDVTCVKLIQLFKDLLQDEWKPSYLQQNIGTLIPFILDKKRFDHEVLIDLKVNYSSIIFENKKLSNLHFSKGDFININFRLTQLSDVIFENCRFNSIRFEIDSDLKFDNVTFLNCTISSISVLKDEEEIESIFSPIRINQVLGSMGIHVKIGDNYNNESNILEGEFKRLVNKFLLKYNKTIYQYEKNIVNERHYGNLSEEVVRTVIPLLQEYSVIEERETKQSRQSGTRAWRLSKDLKEIFLYDGTNSSNILSEFWKKVNEKEFL